MPAHGGGADGQAAQRRHRPRGERGRGRRGLGAQRLSTDGPTELHVGGTTYVVRRARADDVAAIVALLADDELGSGRELDDLGPYDAAFAAVDADRAHHLAVVDAPDGTCAGTVQLTVLPGLSRGGTTRLQVEGVRVARSARGGGLGAALLGWAEEHGRARGATLVQLTTDLGRHDAKRFYERLGYVASHAGMKKPL